MSLKGLIERIEQYFRIREINRFLKKGMPSIACEISIFEIEKNVKEKKHDVIANDSVMIAKEIFSEPEFKNNLFEELYYAKETGNYKEIENILIDYNSIKVNPGFTYLYDKIHRN